MSHPAFVSTASRLRPFHQSGVVLVVVLLFMLALTTVAIFGARNVTMGERQARNESEYQVARQAAEAALRDAERDLYPDAVNLPAPTTPACNRSSSSIRSEEHSINAAEFTTDCLGGQCGFPASDSRYQVACKSADTDTPGAPWWPNSKGGLWATSGSGCTATGPVPLGRYTGVAPLTGVAQQPDYLIEYLGDPTQATVQTGFSCQTAFVGSSGAAVYNAADENVGGTKPFTPSCHLFRITARGFGPTINTQVVVQSYFSIVVPESE